MPVHEEGDNGRAWGFAYNAAAKGSSFFFFVFSLFGAFGGRITKRESVVCHRVGTAGTGNVSKNAVSSVGLVVASSCFTSLSIIFAAATPPALGGRENDAFDAPEACCDHSVATP